MQGCISPFDRFHKESLPCDPDLPTPLSVPRDFSREELKESDYEPCEVCFPDWE